MASRRRFDVQLLLMVVVVLCFIFKGMKAAGAGRAFPIVSENYVTENFQRVNPKLEWDRTNFLVDLAGQYANCRFIGTRGSVQVDRKTPEDNSIVGYVDYTDGLNVDVNSVNSYLKRIIDRWMSDRHLNDKIRGADRFGCSVRPGCNDQVAVSCLFSPAGSEGIRIEPAKPKALAFTPEQYEVAERITNKKWDRSHFLENLSGLETSCDMIELDTWHFTQAQSYAQKQGLRYLGTYGHEQNKGSTPEALERILNRLKQVHQVKQVGCSLIPDCMNHGQMYVVVSCIFEEY